jgi:hypothetical protein
MGKEEFIKRYGEEAYEKKLEQNRQRTLNNPDIVRNQNRKQCRKSGEFYLKTRKYQTTHLQGKRNKVRNNHRWMWGRYKKLIAPGSQIHHEWVTGTAEYKGVALVEKDPHIHGIIDVIQILEGKITLFSEKK